MSMITLDEFNNYSGNFEDDCESKNLKELYIKTAERIVVDYLGYDPREREYFEILSGLGDYKLYLHALPIKMINSLIIDDRAIDTGTVGVHGGYIYDLFGNKIFKCGVDNIKINYIAGFSNIPAELKTTILRIATLLLMEQGENIGITSKSFADNSRTFFSYQNYDKYLKPLEGLRVINFMGTYGDTC